MDLLFHVGSDLMSALYCAREIQQLRLSLRKLKIETDVSQSRPETTNPYWPIAIATLNTIVTAAIQAVYVRSHEEQQTPKPHRIPHRNPSSCPLMADVATMLQVR